MTEDKKRIPSQLLKEKIKKLLQSYGADLREAEIIADNLCWNSAIGRDNHGLWRLPFLLRRVDAGQIKIPCKLKIKQTATSVLTVDGKNGFGQYIGYKSMHGAIDLAKKHGVGVAGVYNSNWNGSGAYYAQLAAQEGMIGICSSNSFPKVAPWGGKLPIFGTNPFAFAAPRANGDSILIDMATSALSGVAVIRAIENNKHIPDGVLVNPLDKQDQDKLLTLQPFGGAKGYALGFLVEILSAVITGAGVSSEVASVYNDLEKPGNNGQFFLALDISRFIPIDFYYERLEGLILNIHGMREDNEKLPRIPGEVRWETFFESQEKGILIENETISKLEKLAFSKNLKF